MRYTQYRQSRLSHDAQRVINWWNWRVVVDDMTFLLALTDRSPFVVNYEVILIYTHTQCRAYICMLIYCCWQWTDIGELQSITNAALHIQVRPCHPAALWPSSFVSKRVDRGQACHTSTLLLLCKVLLHHTWHVKRLIAVDIHVCTGCPTIMQTDHLKTEPFPLSVHICVTHCYLHSEKLHLKTFLFAKPQ